MPEPTALYGQAIVISKSHSELQALLSDDCASVGIYIYILGVNTSSDVSLKYLAMTVTRFQTRHVEDGRTYCQAGCPYGTQTQAFLCRWDFKIMIR